MGPILALLILGGIVAGAIAIVRKVMAGREESSIDGGDIIAYLLMALAVGVAAFALADLAQAAFPGDRFAFGTDRLVATSLAGLVVAAPVAIILWRRQSGRREAHPRSSGWTVYLAIMEAVFTTALVISTFQLLDWLIGDGDRSQWTDVVVFGAVVVFHELASRNTPPRSDAAELPRVVGSAIGLITTAIGLGGTLFWILDELYGTLQATAGNIATIGTWIALLVVGAPIWWYRWWRPWPDEPAAPRHAWTFLVSVAALVAAIGSATWLVAQILIFLFTETRPAGVYFDTLPGLFSVGLVGLLAWLHHRHRLGTERTDPVRAYEYAMSAIGLAASIGGITSLTVFALGSSDLGVVDNQVVIAVTVSLVSALAIWGWFWSRASRAPRELEAGTGPRRFYLIGFGIVTGLVSAGALIATLVILFQRMLATGETDTLAFPAALFVYSGLATWHLLRNNAHDRELILSEEVVTPFTVTIVCSHPGFIASAFPKEARLKVIYRGDEVGVIDEAMAAEIVEAVDNHSSLVWVGADGYRVAPAR
jgi:hypothetical protein